MTAEQQATHSPPPWTVSRIKVDGSERTNALGIFARTTLLAFLDDPNENPKIRANADAMAAAPDLLAAAEAVVGRVKHDPDCDHYLGDECNCGLFALRAAIKKARGKESTDAQ